MAAHCIFQATIIIIIFINLFIFFYFWLCWVFIAVCELSLVAASGGYSSLRCTGFSLRWPLLFRSTGPRVQASVVVTRGLSSCGTRAQLLCHMWDLPGPGIEPVSPALAGRFLTTVPPGKPQATIINGNFFLSLWDKFCLPVPYLFVVCPWEQYKKKYHPSLIPVPLKYLMKAIIALLTNPNTAPILRLFLY